MENWKAIEGYEGLYEVSDLGRVRAVNGKIKKPDNDRGYLKVGLWLNGKRKNHRIHRLVAKAFIPNPYNRKEVNHKARDKSDNRAISLEWVTPLQNKRHWGKVS